MQFELELGELLECEGGDVEYFNGIKKLKVLMRLIQIH